MSPTNSHPSEIVYFILFGIICALVVYAQRLLSKYAVNEAEYNSGRDCLQAAIYLSLVVSIFNFLDIWFWD